MFYIFADGELLYSSVQPENRLILAPTCALEIGMSGSVDFTILPGHAMYDSIDKLKTKIVVYMDEEMIFNGRVLNWDVDFYKQKAVHCEGNLSYLLDTLQPPRSIETTVSAYFGHIINEHNLQVDVGNQFIKGTVSIDDAATTVLFENNGYRDTRSAIDSDLIGVYGGFLRTRTVGAATYLDYIKEYGTTSTQTLEFSSNILDMSQTLSAADIFTVLLPTSDAVEGEPAWPLTIESVNGGSKLLENADGISKFGRIVHTQNFPGLRSAAALKAKAKAYFTRVYREPPVSFTIRALDLHFYNASVDQFLVGQSVRILSAPHGIDTYLTCLSIDYDIENVDNTELTIGTLMSDDADPDSHFNGGSSLSSTVGRAGNRIGKLGKHITEGDDWLKLQADKIDIIGETITLQSGDISTLNSQIVIESGRITAEVTRATTSEGVLSGRITVTESEIDLRVTKAAIINYINISNEGVTIDASKITLTGANGIIVNGSLVVQTEFSAVSATINNLMTGTTTATAIKAANLSSTGNISAGNNVTAGNALNGEYVNATTGSITTLTSSTLNATIINLNGSSLATLLSGKLGINGTAANSLQLGGETKSYFAKSDHTHGSLGSLTVTGLKIGTDTLSRTSKQLVSDVSLSTLSSDGYLTWAGLSVSLSTIYYYT